MLLYQKNGTEFDYSHILNPKLKNIYINIDKKGKIILKSSPYRAKEAVILLENKSKWIKKVLKKIEQKRFNTNIYKNDGIVYYLDKSYPLIFKKNSKKKDELFFDKKSFLYLYNNIENCQKKVEFFYKIEAEKIFTDRVEYFSHRLNLYPKAIKFRKAKRRLGSCSYDDILSFNYLAVKLSMEQIDYIVVHELAHIKEKNHSGKFWNIVKKEFLNYKKIRNSITL